MTILFFTPITRKFFRPLWAFSLCMFCSGLKGTVEQKIPPGATDNKEMTMFSSRVNSIMNEVRKTGDFEVIKPIYFFRESFSFFSFVVLISMLMLLLPLYFFLSNPNDYGFFWFFHFFTTLAFMELTREWVWYHYGKRFKKGLFIFTTRGVLVIDSGNNGNFQLYDPRTMEVRVYSVPHSKSTINTQLIIYDAVGYPLRCSVNEFSSFFKFKECYSRLLKLKEEALEKETSE